jgi:hypothetical protein
MTSSLFRHFNLANEDHGGNLFFSERVLGDQIPFRGVDVPPLKDEELDELEVRHTAHVRTFDTSSPEDLKEYEIIVQRAVAGWYSVLERSHHWDDQKKCMLVYVEWVVPYREMPDHLARTITEDRRAVR